MSDSKDLRLELEKLLQDLSAEAWRCGINDEPATEVDYWIDQAADAILNLTIDAAVGVAPSKMPATESEFLQYDHGFDVAISQYITNLKGLKRTAADVTS